MSVYQEGDRRFRVKQAEVNQIVANFPIKLPEIFKMLARRGDWQSVHDGLLTQDQARKVVRNHRGPVVSPEAANSFVRVIEEVHARHNSS